ncbi:putative lysine-specific demethylase JMJ16 [Forsythia ovata]|uniref:Lysine-specific demethylase JMJ16 n=1 Tax=Forsythia ovata TaxID=205694 RepID=A0ABD1WHK1_9LAMI
MWTELAEPQVKEEKMEIPSIPPGFESLAPFTLKRVDDDKGYYSASDSVSESQASQSKTEFACKNDSNIMKSLRRRSSVNYTQFSNSSSDDSDSEQTMPLRPQLPRGVIRGCEQCNNCQKVTAKWRPEEARRPDLVEAPVFYPTEEEFEDTLNYIASIRSKAEIYGICRIVPPPSWQPPCPLKENNIWDRSKFTTRIQRIDKLQNRDIVRKILRLNQHKRRKRRRCMKNEVDRGYGNEDIKIPGDVGLYEAERFGFEPGPEFTLDTFQKYADDFKAQYFRKNNNSSETGGNKTMLEEQWQPLIENIEGEYWRTVEKPTEEIEVLYGADLETGVFGSGFPKNSHQAGSASNIKYINSGWNLNNFPRLSGSVLSFESSDISGVLVPWLYIGMCFSSFCWHVEDHHLYSLNYMHWGAPKIWYGVPGSDALKLEAAMRKHLPDLFEEQPDLLHKLVTQLSPFILRSEGVPVYRCVQNPGEFVLTFPRAYHAGFNCGFNCAEAVNVAPVDWLPHGQNAIELYCEQGRKTSISHDKLLLGAAREAVKANWEYNLLRKYTSNNLRWKDVCGEDGILSKALKTRVEMERVRREFLCKSSQAMKMESSFDAFSERECSICLFDLHLSAAGCHRCSPDKYACLNHAKQLCSCSGSAKFFLFRYDINELNLLVEALEGKLSAVYRWARLDLGLALSSYLSKDNKQVPWSIGKLSHTHALEGLAPKEMNSQAATVSSKEQKDKANAELLNLTKVIDSSSSLQKEKLSGVLLTLEKMEIPANNSYWKVEEAKHTSPRKEESSSQSSPKYKMPGRQLSQPPCPGSKDIIVLSDDEGDATQSETSDANGTSEKHTGNIEKPFGHGDVASLGNCDNEPALTTTINSVADMGKRMKCGSSSECIKVEDHVEGETCPRPNLPSTSCHEFFVTGADFSGDVESIPLKKETAECNMKSVVCALKAQRFSDEKPSNKDSHKMELDAISGSMDNVQTVSCNPSVSQNNLDGYCRQKGPRIAKVVRRINCNVEALEFGTVHAGKLWCDTRAIYTKGFRSRVRYINALDPTNMCYYISEILDAGRDGPLFMVSLEDNPSEVFVHVSAARCWELVRERVNQEITKQHKLGRKKLPPLQPPRSLDGMEMFGFSSPAIMQVLQGMDQDRVCSEYWKSRPLIQIQQHSQTLDNCGKYIVKSEPSNDQEMCESHPLHTGIDRILHGLFKKANLEELHALYSILHNKSEKSTNYRSSVTHLLDEEIHRRPR